MQYKEDFKDIITSCEEYIRSTNEILAEQYFVDLNAQVEKYCRRNLPITEWHNLRKLIKQRLYSYNWVTMNQTTTIQTLLTSTNSRSLSGSGTTLK